MSLLGHLLTAPLKLYRRFISPYTPATCRFSPTCSQYAIDAIRVHGALRGLPLAVWRILRCQPFCQGGHDPVPPSRRKSSSSS